MPEPTCRAEVRVRWSDPATAQRALGAVHADDDEFLTTRVESDTLIATAAGRDTRSLLRSVDDFLACLSVAEDVMNAPSMERPNA